jgi:hypothetical protein
MAVPSQHEKVARQNWPRPSLVDKRSSAAKVSSVAFGVASVVSLMALISSFRLRHAYGVVAVKIVSLVSARKFADKVSD